MRLRMTPSDTAGRFDPAKRAYTLLDEFKHFALKGNVIDLAVGVVIGAAFGKLVSSLVDNVFMPLLGLIVPGNERYAKWTLAIGGQQMHYGLFLSDVVYFLAVALALFIFIKKFLGWVLKARHQAIPAPASIVPTKEEELLTEIRDLLKPRTG